MDLGRWTGGAQTQGDLPEAWTAPSGLFPTEARNDNSVYTFTSSTSTLTLPSSGLADGYLVIARYEYHGAHDYRFNPQGRLFLSSGTGNVVNPPAGGYLRNNANDVAWVSCFLFVDNPSTSAEIQFEWKADEDDADASSGTNTSSLDVIPFYYSDASLYSSTDHSLLGGTTPNVVPIDTTVSEGTNITRSTNTITVSGDNKRYMVISGQSYGIDGPFSAGRAVDGARTQRWFGHSYDGTLDRAAQAYTYYRNNNNQQNGGYIVDILETSTANRTIEITCYTGDGVSNGAGGADDDGTDPDVGDHGIVVLELNDGAEIFRTADPQGGQALNNTGGVSLDVTGNGSLNGIADAGSWSRSTDQAMQAASAFDALVGANIAGASTDITSTIRLEARANITQNGAEDSNLLHGNYLRGENDALGTFGWGANPAGFLALSTNDTVGAEVTQTGSGHPTDTQAGWVGFWGINLDTLQDTGGTTASMGISSDIGYGMTNTGGATAGASVSSDITLGMTDSAAATASMSATSDITLDMTDSGTASAIQSITNAITFGMSVSTGNIAAMNVSIGDISFGFSSQMLSQATSSVSSDIVLGMSIAMTSSAVLSASSNIAYAISVATQAATSMGVTSDYTLDITVSMSEIVATITVPDSRTITFRVQDREIVMPKQDRSIKITS